MVLVAVSRPSALRFLRNFTQRQMLWKRTPCEMIIRYSCIGEFCSELADILIAMRLLFEESLRDCRAQGISRMKVWNSV